MVDISAKRRLLFPETVVENSSYYRLSNNKQLFEAKV